MPLLLLVLVLLTGFVEFKLISTVYTFLAQRYDGLSAIFLIGLSFFLALSLGMRLIRGVAKTGRPMHLLAGILFIIPGYLSDIFALLVLMPLTGWLFNRLASAYMQKILKGMNFRMVGMGFPPPGAGAPFPGRERASADTDPTIIDVEAYDSRPKLH